MTVGSSQVKRSVTVHVLSVDFDLGLGQEILDCLVTAAEGRPVEGSAAAVVGGVEGER